MSRLVLLSVAAFVLGLTVVTSPALAAGRVVCDVTACIAYCQKLNPSAGASHTCASNCAITVDEHKKKGQCK